MTQAAASREVEMRRNAHQDVGVRMGEKIKRARQAARMTQQQLADELGVSLRTITSWERGQNAPLNRLPVIESVLGISLDDEDDGPSDALRDATDRELLDELARRLAAQRSIEADGERQATVGRIFPAPSVITKGQLGEDYAARRPKPTNSPEEG